MHEICTVGRGDSTGGIVGTQRDDVLFAMDSSHSVLHQPRADDHRSVLCHSIESLQLLLHEAECSVLFYSLSILGDAALLL